MKKEELERLKARYWAAESSLEEERFLKNDSDSYFSLLKEAEREKMELDFDSFVNRIERTPEDSIESLSLSKRISYWKYGIAVAATFLLMIGGVWMLIDSDPQEVKLGSVKKDNQIKDPVISDIKLLDVRLPVEYNKSLATTNYRTEPDKQIHRDIRRKQTDSFVLEKAPDHENFYVEVNGVRITDEDEALRITHSALTLASSNIEKGIEGVRKLKHLAIQL
jgi:hypothetical protein